MIISEDFLRAIKCCEDGIVFAKHFNLIGLTYQEALDFLKDNNHTHPYQWFSEKIKSKEAIIYRGNFTVKQYHIFNPLTGIYETAETEQEAKLLKEEIIKKNIEVTVLPFIDTKKELVEPDGTSVLINCEIK